MGKSLKVSAQVPGAADTTKELNKQRLNHGNFCKRKWGRLEEPLDHDTNLTLSDRQKEGRVTGNVRKVPQGHQASLRESRLSEEPCVPQEWVCLMTPVALGPGWEQLLRSPASGLAKAEAGFKAKLELVGVRPDIFLGLPP